MTNDLTSIFAGKKILITGGTGSLGQALTKRLLEIGANTIRIFSRNESKQIEMEDNIKDDRLKFFIGDVRDFQRLLKAVEGADFVFHTAALKHVPKIEYNPFEAIKTNVVGSQNVIDASLDANVDKVVYVGTDKAVSPLNTYGATKLLAEKLFVSANNYFTREKTKFFAVRYGNVLGSSGSVIPLFIKQIKSKQKITITNSNMTRFSLTMSEALDFILHTIDIGKGSEIFIPKLRAYSITDVKSVLKETLENTGEEEIGIRPGEKLHEEMISNDESMNTLEFKDYFTIIPNSDLIQWSKKKYLKSHKEGKICKSNFSYNSKNNVNFLNVSEIKKLIHINLSDIQE